MCTDIQTFVFLLTQTVRVDEGRKGWSLFAKKMEARTVLGRGEDSLLSAPGSELHLGRQEEHEKGL